jgi:hypothetical protein
MGMQLEHGQDMDIDYYWAGADSGKLYLQKLWQKSYQKFAKVSRSANKR